MSKINMKADRGELINTLMLNCVSKSRSTEGFQKMIKDDDFDPENIDVKLTVNGVEFDYKDFSDTLQELIDNWNRKIKDLKDMSIERFREENAKIIKSDIENKLYQFTDKISSLESDLDLLIDKMYE